MILNNREVSGLRKLYEATKKELKETKKLNHDNAMEVENLRVKIMELEQKLKTKERKLKILQKKLYEKEK